MSSTSRYIRTVRRKTRGEKRVVWIHGAEEDDHKYVRCWNCGFIVDTTRDLGDPYSDGRYQTDFPIVQEVWGCGNVDKVQATINTVDTDFVMSKPIPDSSNYPYAPRKAEVSKGCPLCGTSNLT